MEHVKLKSWSGVAKLTGVVLCLAGVLVIALYAGPSLSPVNHHHAFASHGSRLSGANAAAATRGAWVKWTFLMVLANTMWSLLIVLQVSFFKWLLECRVGRLMQEQYSTAWSLTIICVFCNPKLLILLPCGSLLLRTQAPLLEECPDKILVTAAQCVFSTVQSFVVAVVAERDFSRWKLNLDVSLLAIFYSVSFSSSFSFFLSGNFSS